MKTTSPQVLRVHAALGWRGMLSTLAILPGALAGATMNGEGPASLPLTGGGSAKSEVCWPAAVAVSADRCRLFVSCGATPWVLVLDPDSGAIQGRIQVPSPAAGLVLSRDGAFLYAACAAPRSTIGIVDVAGGVVVGAVPVGHTAVSPVMSPDGTRLAVCNRFDGDVSIVDLVERRQVQRIRVMREPVAAAFCPDGRRLVVAGHLPEGPANRPTTGSEIAVVDIEAGRVVSRIPLRPGSGLARGIAVSPDGGLVAVTHILAHYHWLPRMAYLGWINQNVVSLISLKDHRLLGSVPLDDASRGAANPWGIAWTEDGERLVISHAGTHELSVIEVAGLVARIDLLPEHRGNHKTGRALAREYYDFPSFGPAVSRFDLPSDFSFLEGLRTRIQLGGIGPRAFEVSGRVVDVACAFSDSIEVVDLSGPGRLVRSIALGDSGPPSIVRLGERWFNDATLCVQGWQSCASCHDADARCDGLNWDLLNDGPHSPKNTRSLLHSPQTPPVMALGVRDGSRTAVQAGIRHILFGDPQPEVVTAIDCYLQSLRPVASPRLRQGRLTPAAERGRAVFERTEVGCAGCHVPPLFTDLETHDVGTAGDYDGAEDRFDTPALVECWRTAPYLHDGSATTVHQVLTVKNPSDKHGQTSGLTPEEINDLAEYVLSL